MTQLELIIPAQLPLEAVFSLVRTFLPKQCTALCKLIVEASFLIVKQDTMIWSLTLKQRWLIETSK